MQSGAGLTATWTVEDGCLTALALRFRCWQGLSLLLTKRYESVWLDVQSKCKNLDVIGRYSDLRAELQKASNQRGEFSLPWLYSRRDLNAACLTARSTRENSCWKDQIDSGHQEQIDQLKEALNATEGLINESIRNGKAYKVDRAQYDELVSDEDENCRDLHTDFDWLSIFKEDEPRTAREFHLWQTEQGIAEKYASQSLMCLRTVLLRRGETRSKKPKPAESEAKRMLDIKQNNHLCQ